ncbi:hypothetical protein MmTuc01_0764 [Methanosarcina mazei Tuc01]|uniref:Uncharacterized protein n=1 Tax=Methanosarcina mazei Tuc01 TaxID=1236903 RepID=M1P6Y0_METMZ|nr:hypothetical protein MmTuc01_0764 [Methanosarcina mazei Tuc01]
MWYLYFISRKVETFSKYESPAVCSISSSCMFYIFFLYLFPEIFILPEIPGKLHDSG